ncbi:MAG: hypothetical protein R3350_09140, partial [Saprospiraceae bacterium]|nr:hypothetical protein [Saprospiraceae bacterium]
GNTPADTMEWVATHVEALGGDKEQLTDIDEFDLTEYELEEDTFEVESYGHHQELARYRQNAEGILQLYASKFEHASPVRTWPGDFDSASHIPLVKENGKAKKTIEIGLSIADEHIDEIYFYVKHALAGEEPEYDDLPAIEVGDWHDDEWTGAILKSSSLLEQDEQEQAALDFFKSAIGASIELLGLDKEEFSLQT